MKSPTDVVSGFILLGLCGVGAYSVATLPDAGGMEQIGPGFFPTIFLVLLSVLSVLLIFQGLRRAPRKNYWPEPKVFKKILIVLGLFYLYLITLIGLGDLFLNMEHPRFKPTAHSASAQRFSSSSCFRSLAAVNLLKSFL